MRYVANAVALAAVPLLMGAVPAQAQLGMGGHVVHAADAFDGTTGVGARLRFGVPVLPISAALNGEYFFPDCGDADCSYYGGSLDVNYALPLPLLQPYVGVGWSVRRVEIEGADATENGLNVGAGVELRLTVLRPYLDLRYEFMDEANEQLLIRLGLMLR